MTAPTREQVLEWQQQATLAATRTVGTPGAHNLPEWKAEQMLQICALAYAAGKAERELDAREMDDAWRALGGKEVNWLEHTEQDGTLVRDQMTLAGAIIMALEAARIEGAKAENEACEKALEDVDVVEYRFAGQTYENGHKTIGACKRAIAARRPA